MVVVAVDGGDLLRGGERERGFVREQQQGGEEAENGAPPRQDRSRSEAS